MFHIFRIKSHFWCFSYAARLSKGLASSWPCLTTNHDTYKWSERTFFSSNWQSEAHVHCLKAQVVQGHAPTLYKGAAGLLFKVLSECQLKSCLFLKRNVYSKAAPSWSGWNLSKCDNQQQKLQIEGFSPCTSNRSSLGRPVLSLLSGFRSQKHLPEDQFATPGSWQE